MIEFLKNRIDELEKKIINFEISPFKNARTRSNLKITRDTLELNIKILNVIRGHRNTHAFRTHDSDK